MGADVKKPLEKASGFGVNPMKKPTYQARLT
jgi:hypothetical protein